MLTIFLALKSMLPLPQALRYAAFQVVSVMTTTGFASHDFEQWPIFGQFALLLLFFFGGCAGSTGGSVKHMRIIWLVKHAYWQPYRLLHPRAVASLRLGEHNISGDVLIVVQAFFVLYIACLTMATLCLTIVDVGLVTALSAAA